VLWRNYHRLRCRFARGINDCKSRLEGALPKSNRPLPCIHSSIHSLTNSLSCLLQTWCNKRWNSQWILVRLLYGGATDCERKLTVSASPITAKNVSCFSCTWVG
jgi:hypothetical protein